MARSGSGFEASATSRRRSAFWIWWTVRWMPWDSMESEEERMPAVSMRRMGRPWRLMVSSMVSRVVPAVSETMARSKPRRWLRSEDLPTLGSPKMTVRTPSRRTRPWSAVASRESMVRMMEEMRERRCWVVWGSISSSGKSIHASR
jgi:hypothetical protein